MRNMQSSLTWLREHAQHGAMPPHLSEVDRDQLIGFVDASLEAFSGTDVSTEDAVKITLGKLEGDYA